MSDGSTTSGMAARPQDADAPVTRDADPPVTQDADAPVTRAEFLALQRTVERLLRRSDDATSERPRTDAGPDGSGDQPPRGPHGPRGASDGPRGGSDAPPVAAPAGFWALEGLRARIDDPSGAVLLTGSVELTPGEPHAWQQGATTQSLIASTWSDLAPALDALGHPVRLQLLQLVATGTTRTADLGSAEGLGTSGQLHHHLRQLVATGWLRTAGRGRYEIPATRLVPLLVILTAAER